VSSLTQKHRRRVWLACMSMLALLFLLSVGKRGCYEQARVQVEKKRIETEIATLEKDTAAAAAEKKKLEDPAEVEKLAREKYGMSKKDEKVYRVVPREKK
jgi:cell division protein FtsL